MRESGCRSTRAQRGSAMVVMLVVLVGLGTIAGLTVISVQGGSSTTNTQRFSAMARYAAESGGAAAMHFLKTTIAVGPGGGTPFWTATVSANNTVPPTPTGIPGNDRAPGDAQNLLSMDQRGWYHVAILNNPSDPGFAIGQDQDAVVIIRSTGYGPNGAVTTLEWEVASSDTDGGGTPLPLTLIGWREARL